MASDSPTLASGLIVCAPLPPPVDGLAFASLKIVEALETAEVPLLVFDVSGGIRNAFYHFKRVWRAWTAALAILFSPRSFAWVYMPVNAGAGVLYNLIIAVFARFRGKRIFLHHHSFQYVDTKNRSIIVLLRLCGTDTVQIVLCDCMRDKLEGLYGKIGVCLTLPSDYYSAPREIRIAAEKKDRKSLVIGHLSNLTLEKGLDICIGLHRALIARGDAVNLVVGGPCSSPAAKQVLDAAISEFPDSLLYLGPLDEMAKDDFYRRVDIFLFPTRYSNEADPIVVSDAQSYGLATIVAARGCLGERVDDSVGIVVPRDVNFVDTVVELLPDFEALCHFAQSRGPAARMRHLALRSHAVEEFSKLLGQIKPA